MVAESDAGGDVRVMRFWKAECSCEICVHIPGPQLPTPYGADLERSENGEQHRRQQLHRHRVLSRSMVAAVRLEADVLPMGIPSPSAKVGNTLDFIKLADALQSCILTLYC
eukprot:SAG31_NODE_630_length_13427_cov_27.066327_1_plen_111_part_00